MRHTKDKPTPVFRFYFSWLTMRSLLFLVSFWLLIKHPERQEFTHNFVFGAGLSFPNLVFYLLEGGTKQLKAEATCLIANAPASIHNTVQEVMDDTFDSMRETTQGIRKASRQVFYGVDVLRVLPWPEEDLTAPELLRHDIRRKCQAKIVPVIVFGLSLVAWSGCSSTASISSTKHCTYMDPILFLFNMFYVVLWCPLQLMLMRNRCCTAFQIHNWDGVMTVPPLIPIVSCFSVILIILALAVLIRWEFAFLRHLEGFDERTNASLQCKNCKDNLCHLRKPLHPAITSHQHSKNVNLSRQK